VIATVDGDGGQVEVRNYHHGHHPPIIIPPPPPEAADATEATAETVTIVGAT
jgi:hypothetical protein